MNQSIESILRSLEGLNTIDLVARKLNVKKNTAIKKLHELRKLGFVETSGGGKQPRLYRISRRKMLKIGNPGLYDVINKNSPIKLSRTYEERIVGRKLSIEEVLIRAIKTEKYRVIMASLALFNKVKDIPMLYKLAKRENVRRKLGALYEVARRVIKTRRIGDKYLRLMLNAKNEKAFIIPNVKSKDFRDIENKWKVYIPFNKQDLWRLKE
ncbi:hypothetical protein HYV89_02495 [Candidatus Woesearchaeota archaeon]|nr:hypothetical protein [Candidatus Woesearchaeota archaeon]